MMRPEAALPETLRLLPSTRRLRTIALLLLFALFSFAVAALLAPWQQSLSGTGRVTAFRPAERRQAIESTVSGRVVRWFVSEGARVKLGDPLVALSDNDPNVLERLGSERAAVSQKITSYEERVDVFVRAVEREVAARNSYVRTAEAKLRAAISKVAADRQKLEGANAALETAQQNADRVRAMAERGLSARRELELAELALVKARTEREGAFAELRASEGDRDGARAALDNAVAEGDAKVLEAEAKLRSGRSDSADSRASLTRLDGSIARQESQLLRAPCDGVVMQVVAAQGGEQVKQGDVLAYLVPDNVEPAVELWIDGNDAALVTEGRHVRLQFEGWPAVQFTGWPSVAVGTFGGTVAFVAPHDDGRGNFRLLVVPDERSDPWPSARFLRQGVRVKGWLLLEEVRLGFELWRRFNGFPPLLEAHPDNVEDKAPTRGKERS